MTDQLVGRNAHGDRIYVSIRLDETSAGGRFASAATHEPVDKVTRLAISGLVVPKGCRNAHGAGQIQDELENGIAAENGWTTADVAELREIWRDWHLNDLRAGCDHMALPDDTSYDARMGITCPLTGYKYGSAWLVSDLPAEVEATARRLQSVGRGEVYRGD